MFILLCCMHPNYQLVGYVHSVVWTRSPERRVLIRSGLGDPSANSFGMKWLQTDATGRGRCYYSKQYSTRSMHTTVCVCILCIAAILFMYSYYYYLLASKSCMYVRARICIYTRKRSYQPSSTMVYAQYAYQLVLPYLVLATTTGRSITGMCIKTGHSILWICIRAYYFMHTPSQYSYSSQQLWQQAHILQYAYQLVLQYIHTSYIIILIIFCIHGHDLAQSSQYFSSGP